jgi:pimeloyl-ACP methyl ester carboxylesterase
MKNAARLLLASLLLSLANSCARAPVEFRRVVDAKSDSPSAHSLHHLLSHAIGDPGTPEGKHALALFVEEWKKEQGSPAGLISPGVGDAGRPRYQVTFESRGVGAYPLSYFDEVSPASDYEVKRLKHHKRAGIGAPLVAWRENQHQQPLEKYFPPEGITRPLTALATAGPMKNGTQQVKVELLCPLVNSTVLHQGLRQPVAADFTVPWAALLSRTGELNQSRISDMLRRMPKRKPQLYLMEPYDPQKEPLIMIHGLLSTPLAWNEMSNGLWADDAVRQRYQIWHYLYNTSAPALYSARLLRNQLEELRELLDPEGRHPASRKTTLLTHSMGGLVGKTFIVKPGDAFWKAAFTVRHESLKLNPKERAELEDAFEWQPDPTVHRVIFVAVPHLGSSFADNFIGRIGRFSTAPPRSFQDFYERISASNPNVFTPEYAALGQGKLDSVSSLSPSQPTLRILAKLPVSPGVKVHSIIGNRGKPGPLEKSSDGVVPYTSSHLDFADSELIVPAGHGAFRHPDAMAEIARILKL